MMRFILDIAIAVWIILMGVLFVLSPFLELLSVSRCVYIVVLGLCMTGAAISVMLAISCKRRGRSET